MSILHRIFHRMKENPDAAMRKRCVAPVLTVPLVALILRGRATSKSTAFYSSRPSTFPAGMLFIGKLIETLKLAYLRY